MNASKSCRTQSWRARARSTSRWKSKLEIQVDENLHADFAAVLGDVGFEAATVAQESLSGTTDSVLVDRCRSETRVLVTLDLDFAIVQAHPPGTHAGIIVFRSKSQDELTLISLLKRMAPVLKRGSPEGQLWIVQPERIRYQKA